MKRLFLLTFIFTCFTYSKGLDYDLYSISDVRNISEERKNLLNELFSNEDGMDIFKHFYFSSKNPDPVKFKTDEKDFTEFTDGLAEEVKTMKKPNHQKIIALIYDKVNYKYVLSLDIYSSFSDLFETGKYNYYTSAALYIAVLDKLNIPFQISEQPTHVEVKAYPEEENILLIPQSVLREIRYIEAGQEFMNSYITKLRENKLITANDIQNKTNMELFNEEYFYHHIKRLKHFIGILYFKECLGEPTEIKGGSILNMAIIGNIYFPSFRGNMLIATQAASLLSERKYETIESIKHLELASRPSFLSEEKVLFSIYDDFTDKVLFERSNLSLYDTCSKYLINKTMNLNFKRYVEIIYNSERGRFFFLKGEYKNAMSNLFIAHKAAPENIKLTNMFVNAMFNRFQMSEVIEDEDTSGLTNYMVDDSFLLNDSRYRIVYGFYIEDKILMLYKDSKFTDGDKYLEKFEKLILRDSELRQGGDELNEVYTIPANYYLKNKNYKKAKEYLTRGLSIFPKNGKMTRMLAAIK